MISQPREHIEAALGEGRSGIRIIGLETLIVNANLRNWVFVKVTTNEPGLHGWGESSLEWRTRSVAGALSDVAPLVIDQDPLRIEHLWQSLYRHHFFKGGAVTMSAISGIDQALHDIAGKFHGVPVFSLLGGRVRDHVRFYDHLGGGSPDLVYGNDLDAGHFAELAKESVSAGFDAIKLLPVPPTAMLEGQAGPRLAAERLAAVRDAVGDDVDVMVDMHGRTTPAMAIRYARELEPHNPWFLEEPCQPENVEAMARVSRSTSIPIAAGERVYTRFGFRPLLEQAACSIIQPDVCHCGGLTEMKKIAAMAETYFVSVAPHNPLGPIATMANLHFALSTSNFLIQEVMRADVPWRDDVAGNELQISGGCAMPPLLPGLGIEIDEKAAAQHPFRPETEIRTFHADGGVADW